MGLFGLAAFTAAFALLGKRLEATPLTAPIAFLALGAAFGATGLVDGHGLEPALHVVAEVALVLLLFLDAAAVDLASLRRMNHWPARMLTIGLPLTVAITALIAWPLYGAWPTAALLTLAAILSPTDAALGQAVVTDERVPERMRRALVVESGLNDGLALPAVLLFASLIAPSEAPDGLSWAAWIAGQLILGPAVGAAIGAIGSRAMVAARDRDLTSDGFEGVAAIAIALGAYLGADAVGGNGFVAAFVAGLAFGARTAGRCSFVYEFGEGEGRLLAWGAFFLIGAVLIPDALPHLDLAGAAVILAALFVARPLAIWIALARSDATPARKLFFGWFGPRGLATALFALLVVRETGGAEVSEEILHIAVNAVWISAILHGVSAHAGVRRLGRAIAAAKPENP